MNLPKENRNNSSKKTIKIILGIFMVIGISLFVFSGSFCFADTLDSKWITETSQMLSALSQFVYVLLWPFLVIAGAALDNSLVYGSFLHLDAALWNLRNIMKNFANFALGFLFIFSIVKNLFTTWGGKGGGNPMKTALGTVKNTLIAGVLIQMSWFIVGMLIDLSTVLIYSVGGLPISMLSDFAAPVQEIEDGEQEIVDLAKRPILKLNTTVDNSDGGVGVLSYYSYGDNKFSPCYVPERIGGNTKAYIVGRKYLYSSGNEQFMSGHCTVGTLVYKYKESECAGGAGLFPDNNGSCGYTGMVGGNNTLYETAIKDYVNYLGTLSGEQLSGLYSSCNLISVWGDSYTASGGACQDYGMHPFTGGIFAESISGFNVESLLENAKSYIGPFITLYSSILEYGEFMNNVGTTSTLGGLFSLVLNTFFAVVLFIPIAILMILLIIRVGMLWVVVAISPILILIYSFSGSDGPLKKVAESEFLKKFSIGEVMKLIFSPVVVVFTISLSIIFLSAIGQTKPNRKDSAITVNEPLLSSLGITVNCDNNGNEDNHDKTQCTYDVLGLVSIKIDAQQKNYTVDTFVWCLVELLCTGIVWFFMKFAIGFMGKKGEELWKSAENLVKNAPIIPLPTGNVGLETFTSNVGLGKMMDRTAKELKRDQEKYLPEWLGGVKNNQSGGGEAPNSEVANIISGVNSGTINSLTPEQLALFTPAFGNVSGEQMVNIIKANKDNPQVIQNIINNNNNYETVGKADIEEVRPTEGKTSADALKLTADQLRIAVQNDKDWIARASTIIGGAVHTRDGVRIVDTVPGTAEAGYPLYTIVTRNEYETHRFGDQPQTVTSDQFNERKNEDKAKYDKMNDYLENLSEKYQQLNKQGDGTTLSGDEATQFNAMKEFFNDDMLKRLRGLDSNRFVQPQGQQN